MKHAPTDARNQFKQIAWPFMEDLLRVARLLTHNGVEAEDLVQDSLLKAWRAFSSFRKGTDIRSWLLTILRRTHIDHLRYNGRHLHCLSLDNSATSSQDPASMPVPSELDMRWADEPTLMEQFGDQEMIDALRSLPQDIRWTVLLVHVEQLDHDQAAAIMEVPVGTVKSRAFRGRQMLKKHLAEASVRIVMSDGECAWCQCPIEQCSPMVDCSPTEPCPVGCAS